MSSFANEAQKVQDEDRQRMQWRRYSAAKSRVHLEGLRDVMLRSEAIDLKDPQTAEVLEYVMKKVIKIENDILFIEKVLGEVQFFQELKKKMSTEIYRELVKSVKLKEVKPNELVLFQSLEKKSQTLNSSNFYVILKGQVIEFQKKAATIQQTKQQQYDSSNNVNTNILFNTESFSPKTRIPSQQANNNNERNGGETTVNRGKKISIDPSNAKDCFTSKNNMNSMSQSPRKFSPPPMKRTYTLKKLVIEADQQQILMKLNDLLESADEQSSFSGSGSYKQNQKLSRFQNLNSPPASPRKIPNSSSPRSPRQQLQLQQPRILKLNMQSMDINEDTIKDQTEEGLRNQQPTAENSNNNRILQELFSECKKHFLQMRATNILSQGDNFGEFDKGNLNLLAHGYISRSNSYLIELTGEIYNNLVQKHREKEMETKIKFLQQFSCFKRYSKQKMKNVLKLFVEMEYFRGNPVYFEDDPAEFIYFVKSGEVELSRVFRVEENETDEEKQEKDEQLNEQVKGYNNAESNEEIMHYLCQGKRLKQMSKLLKNISLTVLKEDSYFGEAEVLSQTTRRSSATVVSVKLLVLALPAQVKQMTKKAISISFYIHNISEEQKLSFFSNILMFVLWKVFLDQFSESLRNCELESIERENILNQQFESATKLLPLQSLQQKINTENAQKIAIDNQHKFEAIKATIEANIPSRVSPQVIKRVENWKPTEVANFHDPFMKISALKEAALQDQHFQTERFLKDYKNCRLAFLNRFKDISYKYKSTLTDLPFYHHIQQNIESNKPQPAMIPQIQQQAQIMLEFCKKRRKSNGNINKSSQQEDQQEKRSQKLLKQTANENLQEIQQKQQKGQQIIDSIPTCTDPNGISNIALEQWKKIPVTISSPSFFLGQKNNTRNSTNLDQSKVQFLEQSRLSTYSFSKSPSFLTPEQVHPQFSHRQISQNHKDNQIDQSIKQKRSLSQQQQNHYQQEPNIMQNNPNKPQESTQNVLISGRQIDRSPQTKLKKSRMLQKSLNSLMESSNLIRPSSSIRSANQTPLKLRAVSSVYQQGSSVNSTTAGSVVSAAICTPATTFYSEKNSRNKSPQPSGIIPEFLSAWTSAQTSRFSSSVGFKIAQQNEGISSSAAPGEITKSLLVQLESFQKQQQFKKQCQQSQQLLINYNSGIMKQTQKRPTSTFKVKI